jgi:hypothetical protein
MEGRQGFKAYRLSCASLPNCLCAPHISSYLLQLQVQNSVREPDAVKLRQRPSCSDSALGFAHDGEGKAASAERANDHAWVRVDAADKLAQVVQSDVACTKHALTPIRAPSLPLAAFPRVVMRHLDGFAHVDASREQFGVSLVSFGHQVSLDTRSAKLPARAARAAHIAHVVYAERWHRRVFAALEDCRAPAFVADERSWAVLALLCFHYPIACS